MTYALQNVDQILMTGTETSLAPAAALSGVTLLESAGGYPALLFEDRQLIVSGTLTIDAETLLQDDGADKPAIRVANGGTLNIGSRTTENGGFVYTNSTLLQLENHDLSFQDSTASIQVESGGTFNWYSGTIRCRAAISFMSGSTVQIFSQFAVLEAYEASTNVDNTEYARLRIRENDVQIDGLTLVRGTIAIIEIPTNPISGLRSIASNPAINPSGAAPANTWIPFEDFDAGGSNFIDVAFWSDKWFRMINASEGSDLIVTGNQSSNSLNKGLVEHRCALSLTANEPDGTTISTFGIYLRGVDHGTTRPGSQVGSNSSYQVDDEYGSVASSNVASYDTDGGILLAVDWNTSGGTRGNGDTHDSHGKADDRSDRWDVRVRSYGYNFSTNALILKGLGGVSQSIELREWEEVTESSGTAQAHTGITVVDHGGSPVAWNGKNWGITVLCNLTTNPTLTASEVFHYLQYHLAQTTTSFNGKNGGAWHNMFKPYQGGYGTETGAYGRARTVKGVRVITGSSATSTSADPMTGVLRMQADDGTFYVPPVSYILTLSSLVAGSRVYVYNSTDSTVLYNTVEATASFAGAVDAGKSLLIRVRNASGSPAYKPYETTATMPSADFEIVVNQELDE